MFQKTLKTLSKNTDYTLQTKNLNNKNIIHKLNKFTYITIHNNITISFFQNPNKTTSTTNKPQKLLHPYKNTLTQPKTKSLTNVPTTQSTIQNSKNMHNYDHNKLIKNTLHPIL